MICLDCQKYTIQQSPKKTLTKNISAQRANTRGNAKNSALPIEEPTMGVVSELQVEYPVKKLYMDVCSNEIAKSDLVCIVCYYPSGIHGDSRIIVRFYFYV